MAAIRFGLILLLVLAFALIGLPLHALARRMAWSWRERLPQIFHFALVKLVKIQVIADGTPAAAPALLAANHVSWVDISVLGAIAPMCFVAKSEVANWPVFGALARAQGSVFVERDKRMKVAAVNHEMALRLNDKRRIVLFPEGTTGNGSRLLRFFTSHFAAASLAAERTAPIAVQAVSIAYQRRDGLVMDRNSRSDIAWYGDTALLPHLWGLVKGGGVVATVTFGAASQIRAGSDRKRLAGLIRQQIQQMNYEALYDRGGKADENRVSDAQALLNAAKIL